MFTDLYSIYRQNTSNSGFWIKKKTWHNHVAQVLNVRDRGLKTRHQANDDFRVIVMIMDTRDNQVTDIVEIAEPNAPHYMKLSQDYKPNYDLPQSMIDYIVKGA